MKLAIKSLCNRQLDLDTKPNKSDDNGTKRKRKDPQVWRDILAFWILGLGSEFGYFVIISAAHDILQGFEDNSNVDERYPGDDIYSIRQRVCAIESAGTLLIVDVVPSMLMNIALPFLPTWLHYRMILVITMNFFSFLMIAETQFLAILGIIFISLAEGMGEVTILSYSAKFDKRVLTAWASGTGSSGIIGSISWAGLIALGVTPRNTLRIMLVVPVIEAAAFWLLLRKPQKQVENGEEKSEEKCEGKSEEKGDEAKTDIAAIETNDCSPECGNTSVQVEKLSGTKAKLKLLPKLSRFILPLHISFILEYVCVSGLFEMIHIDNSWMESDSQYRWFLVIYQIGVFVSRSFGSILKPRNTWWAPILQIVNACAFGYMAINMSASNPWLVFFFIFALGAVGGTCYNHSFHRVVTELPAYQHKFSLGLLTVAESFGTALGALASIPVHAFLCGDLFAER